MSVVKVGENESVESAIKRFKRKCQKDGIIGDIRRKWIEDNVKFTLEDNFKVGGEF